MEKGSVRLPAEWEPQEAVMVSWPHGATDWNYMLAEAQQCYDSLIRAIARHAVVIVVAPDVEPLKERFADLDASHIIFFQAPTNDTWTRDYGPITTLDPSGKPTTNDFGFNAWGGKFESALDNAVTAKMHGASLLTSEYLDNNDFILEGGSIESDGNGTLLTTSSCLLTDTRNQSLSKEQIEQRIKNTLGVKNILWLDTGEILGDDTDGHIDTIARLAPHNTILYCGPTGEKDDPQTAALTGVKEALSQMTNAQGESFNLVELPMPRPITDPDDAHRLPATYANFLIINDAVIMPTYRQPLIDFHAKMALQVAFPDHIIEEVDCTALIRQHGSLHCATMQLKKIF